MAKKVMRGELIKKISGLPESYKKEADELIIRRLCMLAETGVLKGHECKGKQKEAADIIFCFVGTDEEINTMPFIERMLERGARVAVPLCTGKGIMEARIIDSREDLAPGAYGIPEPRPETESIDPSQIGMAVIPCLSCSKDGRRLGHGGGYYDRFFERNVVKNTVIICRERLITEDIPVEPHDISFPAVVTEKGMYVKGMLYPSG